MRKRFFTRIMALALGTFVSVTSLWVSSPVISHAETESEEKEEETDEEETQEKSEEEIAKEKKALQNDPDHAHHFKWIAIMNESESAEGTMNYMCEECGKVWYFRPISAYYAFQGDVAHRIETAKEGDTVRVQTSLFINFNRTVMKALSERPDVSVYVSFLDQEYKGNRVSFTIPAGQDAMSLLDENGYSGFIYLGGIYGLTLEEPMADDSAEADEKPDENKESSQN